jgi:putative hemolysin
MDSGTLTNLGLVVLFVLIGGLFAGTEMALVSLREGQVRQIEASGERGERIGRLVRDPNQFLSAVQVGVTVAGFFSSAYGGATLAPDLAPVLVGWGLAPGVADTAALVLMTLLIAYLSLVLGELVPKRLAMQRAVGFTKVLAPPLNVFAKLMRPVIALLSVSTNAVVRLLGGDPHADREAMSAEELRVVLEGHEGLLPYNRRILADVFRAGERRLNEVMRPRTDVEFLAGDLTVAQAAEKVAGGTHSRYPVTGRSVDDIVGFVHIRDLLQAHLAGDHDRRLSELARPMMSVPATNHVLPTLATMRQAKQQVVLVVDEYGGTDGIATVEDLVEEVVGEIYDEYDAGAEPEDSTLHRGEAIIVDGSLIIQELEDLVGRPLPDGPYETVGGLVVSRLGHLAEGGEVVHVAGLRLEVLSVGEHRVERVQVSLADPGEGDDDADGTAR